MAYFSPPLLLQAAAPPATATFVNVYHAPSDNIANTSYTFASKDCGSTSNGGYVVVGVMIVPAGGGTAEPTALTVNGVSATRLAYVSNSTNNPCVALFVCTASTSGSQDVVVTTTTDINYISISVWRVGGNLLSTTPHATLTSTASSPTGSIATLAGGVCLAVAMKYTSSSAWSWSGLTEDFDADPGVNNSRPTGARLQPTTATTLTVTATPAGGSNPAMVAVSLR